MKGEGKKRRRRAKKRRWRQIPSGEECSVDL